MIRHILFDLDGTLLPMDQDRFGEWYLPRLARHAAPEGIPAEEVLKLIYQGWAAMVRNDGATTNEAVFNRCLRDAYPQQAEAISRGMLDYYSGQFQEAKWLTAPSPFARRAVEAAGRHGRDVYLATNPVFPRPGTDMRVRWAGIDPAAFRDISSYENSSFCKPSVGYFREFLRRNQLRPEECLMVGNDAWEDMAIRELGVPVYLVTDCLENKRNLPLDGAAWTGSLAQLVEKLETLE